MRIVDPVAPPPPVATQQRAVPPLPGRRPVTVGFLENGWPSWRRVIDGVSERIGGHSAVTVSSSWHIPVSTPAPAQLLAEVERVCDLVVVGLGN